MFTRLCEQGALVSGQSALGTFPIRIITEGEGSTGVYTRELLEKYRHVFANKPMFINHPIDPEKPWERNLEAIAGRTGATVEYKVVNGVAGLYTEAVVREKHKELVAEFGDLFGVSVYIEGDGDRDPNTGKVMVESFSEDDPYASVDFVIAAGRGGRVERAMENLRRIEDSSPEDTGAATAGADREERENKMTEEQYTALMESLRVLTESVTGLVTLSESAAAASQETVDAFQVADDVSEALVEAGLPKQGRARVLEAVKSGASIEDAVKAEKDYVKAIAESLGKVEDAPAGRVVEGNANAFSLTKIAEAM